MVIAFVVLAIVALIFLFVYNSRLTKKSKSAESVREEPDVSPAPPAAPEALPPVHELTAAPQVTPAQEDAPHVTETRNDVAKVIAPEASDRTALTEAEAEAHRSASDGDRAYREALRKFAVQPPAAQVKEPAPPKRPDPSSDDAYREALRSMMKDQKK